SPFASHQGVPEALLQNGQIALDRLIFHVRGWPQMILLFLIMRCTPTIRELIVATPLSLSSPSATGLSALATVQRAGAQRLCAMTPSGHDGVCVRVRSSRTQMASGTMLRPGISKSNFTGFMLCSPGARLHRMDGALAG